MLPISNEICNRKMEIRFELQKWVLHAHLPYKSNFKINVNSDMMMGIKDSTTCFLFILFIFVKTYHMFSAIKYRSSFYITFGNIHFK